MFLLGLLSSEPGPSLCREAMLGPHVPSGELPVPLGTSQAPVLAQLSRKVAGGSFHYGHLLSFISCNLIITLGGGFLLFPPFDKRGN